MVIVAVAEDRIAPIGVGHHASYAVGAEDRIAPIGAGHHASYAVGAEDRRFPPLRRRRITPTGINPKWANWIGDTSNRVGNASSDAWSCLLRRLRERGRDYARHG